ncbi:MAG: GIY-YIG nuclease family protein [Acidobacteria bacterium]|nr:GIY-YIG nuclease family protein [Acidobacteriota bacterium]
MAFIYVLTNKAMPGLVKIGFTDRETPERALELQTTGVPFPFRVHRSWVVEDPAAAERSVHMALAKHRVSVDREFFRVSPDHAVALINRLLGASLIQESTQTENCSFVECDDLGVVLLAGRKFCPGCASRVRNVIRNSRDSERLAYLAQNLKPLENWK